MSNVIHVSPNEATATKRRVRFVLKLKVDPTSPQDAIAGAQPQISVDWGAWTNTGIGVLVHLGSGHYYAELTTAILATPGQVIRSRFGDADTIETEGDTVVVTPFFVAISSEVNGIVISTVSPTTTVFEVSNIVFPTANHFVPGVVRFTSGNLRGQAREVSAYALVSGRGRFTVSTAFTEAPVAGDTFVVI
jgi:hypothetical protein